MEYIHYQVKAMPYNSVTVTLDKRANVLLLNKINYRRYKAGKKCSASLKYKDTLTLKLKIPYKGEWHIVVEHGAYQGQINAHFDVK
jgi:hypothetical protein